MRPASPIARLLVALALLASAPGAVPRAPQQEPEPEPLEDDAAPARTTTPPVAPPFAEGPLGNDAFLPLDDDASEALALGDRLRVEAGESATRDARERALREALEAYARVAARLATPAAATLDGVPVRTSSDPDAPHRLVEGPRWALIRRLARLEADERARWRATFGPVAAATGRGARGFAGTEAGAVASLQALDAALERGHLAQARALLAETEASQALLDDSPLAAPLASALEARRGRLAAWAAPTTDSTASSWRTADALEARGSIQLLDRDLPVLAAHAEPGLGVRPGLVAPDARTLLVQTARAVWRVRLDREGAPEDATAHSLDRALGPAAGPFLRPRVGSDPGGWPLQPLLFEGELLLVHGASGGGGEGVPNALARLPLPPAGSGGSPVGLLVDRFGGSDAWTPRWVLSGGARWTPSAEPGGDVERVPALEDLPELEWQPGLVVVDDTLVALGQAVRDRTEAWLVGLEPRRGTVRWTRRLGAGAGLAASSGRFAAATVPRAADPPLVAGGGLVLASTQLGLQALVEPATGELIWTLATRRREGTEPGWSLGGPWPAAAASEGEPPVALLAPPDSDRLYPLRLAPAPPAAGAEAVTVLPLAAPIQRQDEAEALLAAAGPQPLVLRRDGRERTLALLRRPGLAPIDAFHLGPGETFRGRALASPTRVLAASDRAIYLLDRTRDLALLDVLPLERRGEVPGGDVVAAGPWVVVLGFDALWVLAPTR